MKAAIRSCGNISFCTNYQKPVCDSKKLLIHVKAAAINPDEYKFGWPLLGTVVGFDFAGIIEEKGSQVRENFKVGDEVYGIAGRSGTLAEFTTVSPSTIALKPQTLSFVEAASLSIAYLTSLQGLRDYGKIESGDRVLVIGASGGCGTAAVQLAKVFGAKKIIGVCSGKNAELVKSIGATDIVDYTKQTIKEFCQNDNGDIGEDQKFDLVFDTATNSGAGEDYKDISLDLLKTGTERHGQYVALNAYLGTWLRRLTIGLKTNQHLVMMYNPSTEDLNYLAKMIDENEIKPVIIDYAFNGENVEKGFALLKSRRTVGKIVFHM